MKKIVGTTYRKEGKTRERLYKVIECQDCGAKTYARRSGRIQKALETGCRECPKGDGSSALKKLQAGYRQDGRTSHPYYSTYTGMMERCFNPENKNFEHYGFRGITVCVRWIVDFWAFVADMGEKPSPDHTLDRVDNDGDYHPNNTRWSTHSEQMLNRRPKYSLLTPEEHEQMVKTRRLIYMKKYRQKTYQKRLKGWWRENFGLYLTPYVYGPMPWKRTSRKHRKEEAIERGWYSPLKVRKK